LLTDDAQFVVGAPTLGDCSIVEGEIIDVPPMSHP
jgi:hypothetical protein